MIYTIFASVMAYVATNIDDMFINIFLFSTTHSKKDDVSIVLGKYLGTGLLVAFSCLGAYGAQSFIREYIHFLGIVPVLLGIKEIWSNIKGQAGEDQPSVAKGFVLSTALITIANGADNVGVYIPLFASFSTVQLAVMARVFCVMTALWCATGKRRTKLPAIATALEKHSTVIVPAVYILLGLYILFF